MLDTVNKPTGFYTGNGDATARTIDVGGVGFVVAIISAKGVAIATPYTTLLCTQTSTGATTGAAFNGTRISLASVHELLNANGVTYNYQVL